MKVRVLVFDRDFIKNNPELMNELITLKEPIPMRIHSVIIDYYHDINTQRLLLFGDDDEFTDQVREERFVARGLLKQNKGAVKAREYHNDLALEFIKRHPEFAPILKEIKYVDI